MTRHVTEQSLTYPGILENYNEEYVGDTGGDYESKAPTPPVDSIT